MVVVGGGWSSAIVFVKIFVGNSGKTFGAFCADMFYILMFCSEVLVQISLVRKCLLTFGARVAKTKNKT